ncbi:Spc19-domain-containing protein [Glomus cerebriforme]|uniref:DASH complex subunit SPC19 n=1 Tax=Glomus cerebriforme TaxID=658196 RepID=A0A397T4N1_9GLOM|nr:Spc19-domain-containing protein [Glomus cerebriforme]
MTPRRNDTQFANAPQMPMTYIQSLEQCVYRLQDSSSKLQKTVFKLESNSRDFSRIKNLLACQRVYELVTEPEIHDAQSSLAVQIEPRISILLTNAEEMLQELEEKENMLQEEVDKREIELDTEMKKARLEFNQNDKIGKSSQVHQKKQQQNQKNTKKELVELKKKMKRMEKDVKTLEKECEQKEEELKLQKRRVMAERKPSAIKSPKKSPNKKVKNTEIILEKMEEQIKDLDNLIYSKTIFLNDKQRALIEAQHEFEDISEEGLKKKKYHNQPEFFKRALKQIEVKFYAQDDAITEFEALCDFYLKSLDIDHSEILQEISKCQELRINGIENMKNLCKFLFPNDNLGSTVARIVEILLDSKNREIFINKLGLEFPPEQNRLHRLQTAITLLNRFGITEIVCEEELKDGQNENMMILRLMVDN